jgi:predicted metal-binding membrane protein
MPMSVSDFGGFGRRLLSAVAPDIAAAWLMFLMWAVMMVAMMLPSAAPMIETYARVAPGRGSSRFRVSIFAAGYVVVWTLFSALATGAQLWLQRVGIVTSAMTATPIVGGVLLLAAGIYQLTPMKTLCLSQCRSPLGFLMTSWRDGGSGAFLMGLHHGLFCFGCCAMLMILLFVFGVMNLMWVAALSLLVLLEKVLPGGRLIARLSGVAMLAAGVALLA